MSPLLKKWDKYTHSLLMGYLSIFKILSLLFPPTPSKLQ
uniref:Uncharacterized protein n=1 Tax=Rhizophora mucronata TaxID=61149 RepID=A0A2P2PC16_RHIMU